MQVQRGGRGYPWAEGAARGAGRNLGGREQRGGAGVTFWGEGGMTSGYLWQRGGGGLMRVCGGYLS